MLLPKPVDGIVHISVGAQVKRLAVGGTSQKDLRHRGLSG